MKFIIALLILTASTSSFASFRTVFSCENNSVRLDRDNNNFQLVIEHQQAMNYLIEAGAINNENVRDNKIIISGKYSETSWNYFALAPRDNGKLVYQIMISDHNPYTLDVAVGWSQNTTPFDFYPRNFSGYKFYNCRFLNN
jgi:hypothetical protein